MEEKISLRSLLYDMVGALPLQKGVQDVQTMVELVLTNSRITYTPTGVQLEHVFGEVVEDADEPLLMPKLLLFEYTNAPLHTVQEDVSWHYMWRMFSFQSFQELELYLLRIQPARHVAVRICGKLVGFKLVPMQGIEWEEFMYRVTIQGKRVKKTRLVDVVSRDYAERIIKEEVEKGVETIEVSTILTNEDLPFCVYHTVYSSDRHRVEPTVFWGEFHPWTLSVDDTEDEDED